ncbi:MAG: hypothetical protein PWP08_1606 [Methanofollis sp.]|nr:hypothetical protein [Methanofollis sp.]
MEWKIVVTTAFIVAALFSAGCTGSGEVGGGNSGGAGVAAISPGSLNATETADILYLREEEKLARDVYDYFYGLFGAQVFQLTPQGVPGLQAGEGLRFTHITLNIFE